MHRESGLCLDEPVQPIQIDSSQVQIPTLRKCQRGLISQVIEKTSLFIKIVTF
jgi:hypothetical protein